MQQSALLPCQSLCSFTNFLLCMFRLLVAILVRLRLIKMPGEMLVEERSLVEEVTEPGPSQASSSAVSVSTLLTLTTPSISMVLLYPVSCHPSMLCTQLLSLGESHSCSESVSVLLRKNMMRLVNFLEKWLKIRILTTGFVLVFPNFSPLLVLQSCLLPIVLSRTPLSSSGCFVPTLRTNR